MWRHAHHVEDPLTPFEVSRGVQVARARKIDFNDLLHGRGPATHDQDATGQLEALVDVVGDEQDGL
ncbi:MAG: hypothetical protein ACHRXM_27000 [Isosphaerales bacterium]